MNLKGRSFLTLKDFTPEEIKGLLLREMAASGLNIPEKSNKQIAKDHINRRIRDTFHTCNAVLFKQVVDHRVKW